MDRHPGRRPARCRRRPETGAAAVEFALVLPVLVMVILGIVTGGLSFSNAIGVQNAVREGARFAATTDSTSVTWADDVVGQVRRTQFDDGTTAASSSTSVCVQLLKTPATVVKETCSTGGMSGPALSMPPTTQHPAVPAGLAAGTCVVRVLAARHFEINVALAGWTGTIQRGATARYERTCP